MNTAMAHAVVGSLRCGLRRRKGGVGAAAIMKFVVSGIYVPAQR